jgi:hypothetical protein
MAPWLAFSLVEESLLEHLESLHPQPAPHRIIKKNIKTYKTWITNTKEKLNEEEKCTYTTEQLWNKKENMENKKNDI